MSKLGSQILKLKSKGLTGRAIAKSLGCCQSTVTYHTNESYRLRHIQKHAARRSKRKMDAIEYKGGKCVVCQYDRCPDALDFHHLDPNSKDPDMNGASLPRSIKLEKLKPELDKCVLLCCRCHREVHAGLIVL